MKQIAIFSLPFRGSRDEFLPLRGDPTLRALWVSPHAFDREFPNGADLIILPGSLRTVADLQYLRESGGERILRNHLSARSHPVVGICGGYQCLGAKLMDPALKQGAVSDMDGLGLLPIETLFGPSMISTDTTARCLHAPAGQETFKGEEHRSGYSRRTASEPEDAYFVLNDQVERAPRKPLPEPKILEPPGLLWAPGQEATDGLVSRDRLVWGTYIHEAFYNLGFRRSVLARC